MEINSILKELGFVCEIEREDWARFRLKNAPDTPEWALVIYNGTPEIVKLNLAGAQLIKFGKYLKIQEIISY